MVCTRLVFLIIQIVYQVDNAKKTRVPSCIQSDCVFFWLEASNQTNQATGVPHQLIFCMETKQEAK